MKKISLLLSLLLLSACQAGDNPAGQNGNGSSEPELGRRTESEKANEQWYAIGALAAASGVTANGVAEVSVLQNGASRVNVQLNIEPSTAEYLVYLKNPTTGIELKVGKLTSAGGNTNQSVAFRTGRNLEGFTEATVVQDEDTVVASGILRVVER